MIALGCDHGGYELMQEVKKHLTKRGFEYKDCGCYGLEAVEKYGALKGGALALWRILRCNPFSKGGYDPVP